MNPEGPCRVGKLTVEFLRTDGSRSGKIMCFNMLFLASGIVLTGYGTSETESVAADRLLRLQSDPPYSQLEHSGSCSATRMWLLPHISAARARS